MVTRDCSSASHFDSLERSIEVLLNQGDSWVSFTSPKSPLCFDGGETSGNSKASERRHRCVELGYGIVLAYGGCAGRYGGQGWRGRRRKQTARALSNFSVFGPIGP
ncbi:hypothetical protein V6Z11_A08G029800 [Gossypium hirsutum]|uniref:Uncharacterized protein n=1 Tax=Gossypium hirsutum TaxID=3635 RepID=A0A1U8LGB3_GOSHI|nr:uncharacterized protein LOC107926128 [Gossypium hirsutum]